MAYLELPIDDDTLSRFIECVPFASGMEHVDAAWLVRLFEQLLIAFNKEIGSYVGTVRQYFSDHNAQINVVGKVFFHLVEHVNNGDSGDGYYPFAFMATYSTKRADSQRAQHVPLKNALQEFEGDQSKLLELVSTVIKAADRSKLISDLMESGELFSPIKLTKEEAYLFLKELPLYESAGIMCRIPDWWRKKTRRLAVSVSVGEAKPSQLGLEALVDFVPSLSYGDQELSAGGLTVAEAMRLELSIGQDSGLHAALDTSSDVSISNGQWLKSLRNLLTDPAAIEKLPLADSFMATLRAYQALGKRFRSSLF